MEEEEDYTISWEFTNIFKSNDSRIVCVIDILEAFENFPPDTRLNCDDYYSLISVFCENVPYPFIVFVCECVDPSITSGTLLSHRIAFGNFLLAFPCCILFPQFVHKFLTLFKTYDKQKIGVISRSLFLNILQTTFQSFIRPKAEIDKEKEDAIDEEDEDENENVDVALSHKRKKKIQITTIDPLKLPDFSMVDEVRDATASLDEASVQTLFFVMWQKDPTLLHCKSRIKPENYMNLRKPSRAVQNEQQFIEEEEEVDKDEKKKNDQNANNNENNDNENYNDNDNNNENDKDNDIDNKNENNDNDNATPDVEKKDDDRPPVPHRGGPEDMNDENDYNTDEAPDENENM